MFCAALFFDRQLLHSAAASGSNDTAVIYEWLSRVSGDRDNDGIDCESTNNPNGYIPSAPVEPPVETVDLLGGRGDVARVEGLR